jgi:predicted alpha-1,2-mannosidase
MQRIVILVILLAAASMPVAWGNGIDPVDMVNPYIGTTYGGDTFPGPDYPFGMIQWGPDTSSQPSGGGYEYTDQTITGFSLTHLSGPGCPVMNDLGILPVTGSISDPRHASIAFTHVQEHASPGWYDVLLGDNMDLEVSLTSTMRTGLGAFRFPGKTPAHVLFNLGHSGTNVLDARFTVNGDRAFNGFVTSGGFCGMPGHYTVYFAGEFDTPFQSFGAWKGATLTPGAPNASGPDAGEWVDFGSDHRTVKLRVAISFVDIAGARANLQTEATTWDVNNERARAVSAWRAALSHAAIDGGTDAQQHSFWTALYHSLLHPNVISDVDGRYPGFDGQSHNVASGHAEYGNWSGWDVYRTQLQLLGFLFPRETSDMVRSLLDANDQMGWLPRWSLVNDETAVMNGDPGPSLIADAYFFGARDFDRRMALRAMVHGASALPISPGQGWYQERNDVAQYLQLGYVDSHRENSVSHVPNGASETLEYAISDFAIAAFARDLGDMQTYRTLLHRSGNWANLFDTSTDLIEPRDEQGRFVVVPPAGEGQLGFQEGNAEQYTWVVPQDQSGLVRAHGGDAAVVQHLDRFFSALPEHDGDWGTPYIGLNNEPSFGAPFMYLSAHAPARTQSIVRLIETKYFDNAPGGEPGNDDLGAMSAMYLWEVAGLYPQTPGTATLDVASPLFTHVELRSEDGRRIVVDAPNARTGAPYVHHLRVNGKLTTHTWVTVPKTGSLYLRFDVGTTTSTWGSAPGDEPPSFDGGVRPRAGTTVGTNSAATDPLSATDLRSAPFVVTYFDGTVVPLNAQTRTLGNAFTLGERVPDALQLPGSTTIALASIYTNSVAFVDMQSHTLQNRVKTGANPTALALSHDGSTLWVAERGADAVLPIDLRTTKAGTPISVGVRPLALAMSTHGSTIFVADQGSNAVSVVNAASGKELNRIATGLGPSALAMGPDGVLYVADMFSNDVMAIDTKTGAASTPIAVGVFPRAIAISGERVYVANWADSTVSVIDSRKHTVVQTLHTGDQPAALAASPDGKTIYVALSGDNAFQTIDVATGTLSPIVFTPGSSARTVRFP